MVRVISVDDSELVLDALRDVIAEDPGLEVVGTATTGQGAMELIARTRPDLITLDLGLPDMDGFTVVERVMATHPTPILVLTASLRPVNRREAYHAISLGAVEVLRKPNATQLMDPVWRSSFREHLRFVARATVVRHPAGAFAHRAKVVRPSAPPDASHFNESIVTEKLLALAGSAGSARAIRMILDAIRQHFPLPVPLVLALHLGAGMAHEFARHLVDAYQVTSTVPTVGAETDLSAGIVYVVPGGAHMELTALGRARVFRDLPGANWAPSLDHFLRSVAKVYGAGAMAAILSGMGSDGAEGLLSMRRAGAYTFGQSQETCVVYGMPAVARQIGAVCTEDSPDAIGRALVAWSAEGRLPNARNSS